MKKNVSINLFGNLYNVDEDAYELLKRYQQNMRAYFARRDGGEEVCEDIEHRVAELLSELKEEGVEAVTIEHVQEIIHRIGNPEELDGAGETMEQQEGFSQSGTTMPPPPPPHEERSRRRLFRDSEDKMLGGVLSGICHYFGSDDPLPWRIIFVLLCLLSWTTLGVLYLVLWALIPEARTAEERLQMYGRPVNTHTLNEEIMRGAGTVKSYMRDPSRQTRARGCLGTLLYVFILCLKAFGIFILGSLFLAGLVALFALLGAAFMGTGMATAIGLEADEDFTLLVSQAPMLRWLFLALTVSVLVIILLPLYALIRGFLRRPDSAPVSAGRRTALALVWLLALAVAIVSGIGAARLTDKADDVLKKRWHERDLILNTRDGFYLTGDSWDYLERSGWQLVRSVGVEADVTCWTRDPGDEDGGYMTCLELERADTARQMDFRVQKSLEARPGHYRVTGLVYADRPGSVFFAQAGDTLLHSADVTATAWAAQPVPDWRLLAEVLNLPEFRLDWESAWAKRTKDVMKKKRWQAVAYEFDVPRTTTVHYGFTNDPALSTNPWQVRKFRAAYVQITHLGDISQKPLN